MTEKPRCERCGDTRWIQGDPIVGIADEPCGCGSLECTECVWIGWEDEADDDAERWLVCPDCGSPLKETQPDKSSAKAP